MSLPLSTVCCIQLELDGKVKIRFGRPLPKRGLFNVRSFYNILGYSKGSHFP
jgi:hypothetical protein